MAPPDYLGGLQLGRFPIEKTVVFKWILQRVRLRLVFSIFGSSASLKILSLVGQKLSEIQCQLRNRCPAIFFFLKKITKEVYYGKNQIFMANRLVFWGFPSTVHTILCLL